VPWAIDWDEVRKHETRALAERIAPWRAKFPHLTVRERVMRERPERALLQLGAGAQLIVVGQGSVSQTLLHRAECPVAVARTE
jgi:nucleotide-binding universal stress UspA family protein